jgi:hypothetical protein
MNWHAKGAALGTNGSAALQAATRRLSAWEARNRQTIVFAETSLRELQLAAIIELPSPPQNAAYDSRVLPSAQESVVPSHENHAAPRSSVPLAFAADAPPGPVVVTIYHAPLQQVPSSPAIPYQTQYRLVIHQGFAPVYPYERPRAVLYRAPFSPPPPIMLYRFGRPQVPGWAVQVLRPGMGWSATAPSTYYYGPNAPPPGVIIRPGHFRP